MASDSISEQLNAVIVEVFQNYGEQLVDAIKQKLAAADKLASGSLYDSINFQIVIDAETIAFQLKANEYLKWVESGRGTDKQQPPMQSILRWIQLRKINTNNTTRRNSLGRFSKGFKLSQQRNGKGQFKSGTLLQRQTKLAWAIAKNIAKVGFPGMDLYNPDSLDQQLQDDLTQVIGDVLGRLITNEMLESFISLKTSNITTIAN